VHGFLQASERMAEKGIEPFTVEVVRFVDTKIGAVTFRSPVIVRAKVVPQPADLAPDLAFVSGPNYSGIEAIDLYVNGVMDGFPAQLAGVRPGDKFVGMLGQPLGSWEEFSRIIFEHSHQAIPTQIRQGNQLVSISLTPKILEETNEFKQITRKPGVGVNYSHNLINGPLIPQPNRLTHALKMSVVQTGVAISLNILGFVRIFEGRVDANEAVGGPIMIAAVAGRSAEQGLGTFLSMMAFLSVLLGLLNLLPVPILDGGHILFILIEVVRRKPLSLNAKIGASYVGLFLLVSLMAFAFYNDISRYWSNITSIF
jgi:regulator of sigma E protease